MAPRKYSDEQLTEAAELRETGMSCAAIAKRLGMSVGSVSWHCLRLGADSPNTTGNTSKPTGPMEVTRGDHVVRRFTESEDARLIEMERAGWRICDMAQALGRKPNSVRGRLMTLARHEARLEQAS